MAKLPQYILWLDPGTLTGWALYYTKDDQLITAEYEFDELVRRLEHWARSAGPRTVIGCERFVITQNSSRRHGSVDALQVWGAARSAASRHNVGGFLEHQNSSVAKNTCPDAILKAIGWYSTTMGHANDAARHIYRWMCQEDMLPHPLRRKLTTYLEQEGKRHEQRISARE